MFDIRNIKVQPLCQMMIGNLLVTTTDCLIEVVALDDRGQVKPDSFGSFTALSCDDAQERVTFAHTMFNSFKDDNRQLAAQEAFRSLVGGYDIR